MDWDSSEVAAAIWEHAIQRRVIDWDLVEVGLTGTDSHGHHHSGSQQGRFALSLGGQGGRTASYGQGCIRGKCILSTFKCSHSSWGIKQVIFTSKWVKSHIPLAALSQNGSVIKAGRLYEDHPVAGRECAAGTRP